jgi:hypothetical protein
VESFRQVGDFKNVMIAFEAGDASVSAENAGGSAKGELRGRSAVDGLQKKEKEALVGVEPTMADLQSAALATWLQRLKELLPVSLGT